VSVNFTETTGFQGHFEKNPAIVSGTPFTMHAHYQVNEWAGNATICAHAQHADAMASQDRWEQLSQSAQEPPFTGKAAIGRIGDSSGFQDMDPAQSYAIIRNGSFGTRVDRYFPTNQGRLQCNFNPTEAGGTLVEIPGAPTMTFVGALKHSTSTVISRQTGAMRIAAFWNRDIGAVLGQMLQLGAHPYFASPNGLVGCLDMEGPDNFDWNRGFGFWTQVGRHGVTSEPGHFECRRPGPSNVIRGRVSHSRICTGRLVIGR
jgi:hypothetical protein